MKKNNCMKCVISLMMLFVVFSCTKAPGGGDNTEFDNLLPKVNKPDHPPQTSTVTLKDLDGWASDTLDKGFIHYHFENYVQSQSANQNVNVIELDLNNPKYKLKFLVLHTKDTLSNAAQKFNAVAGINATYEYDATFVKAAGSVISNITLSPGDLRYWKHEGAIFYNAGSDLKITYGTRDDYLQSSYLNIFSGAPMLIDSFQLVGDDFVGNLTGVDLNSLPYEDYRRHQGTRQPRTAYALTENNHLLLITIDGRAPKAAGMTAKEVTDFTARYFDPEYALNMDGGGSTTMYIKGKGVNGIVNYPTDNNKWDHYGQRERPNFLLIEKVDKNATFAGGSGTKSSPYLISNPSELQSMKKLDWSSTQTKPYYFKLTKDIDMIGQVWQPLNNADPYARFLNFDGNGHIIKNLKVTDGPYASMFGIVNGTIKNLGLVDVDIESSSNSSGAIAGYVGVKSPSSPEFTGLIENCFSTGSVSATDAAGGIAGTVGKPYDQDTYSSIINCFSTATVTSTSEGSSRAGGIVGINYSSKVMKCFSAGKVVSKSTSKQGAGGISGWCDDNIQDVVALNTVIQVGDNGSVGRISGAMGKGSGHDYISQGTNCWGLDDIELKQGSATVSKNDYNTGQITERNASYDGKTKSKSYLSDMSHYSSELGWSVGTGKDWASTTNNGLPILEWLYERGDYTDFY